MEKWVQALAVNYATTSSNSASVETNCTATSGTLNVAAGETNKYFEIKLHLVFGGIVVYLQTNCHYLSSSMLSV